MTYSENVYNFLYDFTLLSYIRLIYYVNNSLGEKVYGKFHFLKIF